MNPWVLLYKLGAVICIIGGVLSLPGLALVDLGEFVEELAAKGRKAQKESAQ